MMMPVLFVGHGSPMNAIEKNEFTKGWETIEKNIVRPKAVLCISAHWMTEGIKVATTATLNIIYDFYGFPQALYDVIYQPAGSPQFAMDVINQFEGTVKEDNSWGIDHGTWSVMKIMYPNGDIPTFQMSVDMNADPQYLFSIGEKLQFLREHGVLIMGSGNIVHNLRMMDFTHINEGFDWAKSFDEFILEQIKNRNFQEIFHYQDRKEAHFAVPTTEHFYPLLYILGATKETDQVTVYNHAYMAGSLSMTSYLFTQS